VSTHVETIDTAVVPAARGQSPAAAAWRRLLSSPVARMGLGIVCVFILVAALAPLVHHYDPKTDSSLTDRLKPPDGTSWCG
jgi:peptide/nickel transport system permease protein